MLEAAGHVTIPARYLTATGQLREGAPFSERDLRPPREPLVVEQDGPVSVLVRTGQGWSRHCHAHHPFDVVGWDGCAYPFAFSIRDFEPIVGRIHQPPPVHQTFAGPGFVVCSFVPRPYDLDPRSVKVPYHHANVDSDEVLFYAGGDFMSRRGTGIQTGSLTLHPAGFVHGPQPGSVEAAVARHPHRGDRGDDRHLRPARDQRRGPGGRRCRLSVELGPPVALGPGRAVTGRREPRHRLFPGRDRAAGPWDPRSGPLCPLSGRNCLARLKGDTVQKARHPALGPRAVDASLHSLAENAGRTVEPSEPPPPRPTGAASR